jgi:phosphoserine aminotransferase
MFGPNVTSKISEDISFHHREPIFFSVIEKIKKTFKEKFSIDDSYEILIQTGSGSLAIETVVNSYLGSFNLVGIEGNFKNRWRLLLDYYKKSDISGEQFHVQYETSNSTYNGNLDKTAFFIDGVSAFPYYPIPKNIQVYVTVSSKILGASPVLGIILIKKTLLSKFIGADVETYLNINRLVKFSAYNQTPTTPSIALYMDLLNKLSSFDMAKVRSKIDEVSDLLVDFFGANSIIGDKRGPVITLKNDVIISEDIAKRYELYGFNNIKGKAKIQIFTYSEEKSKYYQLVNDLKKNK